MGNHSTQKDIKRVSLPSKLLD